MRGRKRRRAERCSAINARQNREGGKDDKAGRGHISAVKKKKYRSPKSGRGDEAEYFTSAFFRAFLRKKNVKLDEILIRLRYVMYKGLSLAIAYLVLIGLPHNIFFTNDVILLWQKNQYTRCPRGRKKKRYIFALRIRRNIRSDLTRRSKCLSPLNSNTMKSMKQFPLLNQFSVDGAPELC